jgi:hypothetical protein
MAEQTFRSPGFFEQEIDLAARKVSPFGTPAGVIGTSRQGPAFVPVTVGSFADFELRFGTLDTDRFGPYAVREFLKNKTALTFTRVLGAGANETAADFQNTRLLGTVKNAGFVLSGSDQTDDNTANGTGHQGELKGVVQFIAARHDAAANQAVGFPSLSQNDSISDVDAANLIRGVVLFASGTRMQCLSNDANYAVGAQNTGKVGQIEGTPLKDSKYFKLVLSSSTGGNDFGSDEGHSGIRILTASLDPNDPAYISKVLNTNPNRFQAEEHLLYLHFDVENELAPVQSDATTYSVAVLSGTVETGDKTTDNFSHLFGRFDTRYKTPRTTSFISQPYGTKEHDLFHVETISDGAAANDDFKISIANLRASTDPGNPYPTFELQVRAFGDTDVNSQILERFPGLTLNPSDERYIARVIGDKKAYFDFDQEEPDERRLIVEGKYPNVSNRIRVRMTPKIEEGEIPNDAIPFGFRGIPTIKTTDTLTDGSTSALADSVGITIGGSAAMRLGCAGGSLTADTLSGSIVPPLPYRFKVTRGDLSSTTGITGQPGSNERVDNRFYWGVKSTKIPTTSVTTNGLLNTNVGQVFNPTVRNYTKFHGIEGIGSLLTGSACDEQNNNKFTLARVAFANRATTLAAAVTAMTGTARAHMKEAAYIRSGDPHKNRYTVADPQDASSTSNRVTLASLINSSSVKFNRFTPFAKFTNIFHGGFDGVNILDKDCSLFRDRAFSIDVGGKATETDPDVGLSSTNSIANPMGKNKQNNAVASFRKAVEIMTDPLSSNINILAIPGVRDTYVTDHALDKIEDYGFAIYLMDSLRYDEDQTRLYDDTGTAPDSQETAEQFEARAVDNNFAATFFPDVFIDDPVNNTIVKVPASVAALGTLGFNDNVAFPWFAPAGFNRGGLDFVQNVETRLSADDRDVLYDARINPIAVFPRTGFVIFGQKTLQQAKSALDRINVRRLMLEVKRQVVGVAERLLFEPNTPATRAAFIARVTPLLGLIQAQAGIEQFKVIMDDTNNSAEDVESNRLNGRIVVVPTRAVEFISIDFIVTNSGVQFE